MSIGLFIPGQLNFTAMQIKSTVPITQKYSDAAASRRNVFAGREINLYPKL